MSQRGREKREWGMNICRGNGNEFPDVLKMSTHNFVKISKL